MCRLHGCRCGGRARGALRARGAFSPPPLHLLLLLLLAPSALGTLSEQDEQTCLMALIGSGFDHHAFDRYGEWYDEKSTARFAQTELFEGVKEIEEYVGITSERSPYLELGEIIDVTATVVERSDDGECVVLYATLMALKATPLGGGLGNMNAATLFTKLHFRILGTETHPRIEADAPPTPPQTPPHFKELNNLWQRNVQRGLRES